MKPMRAFISAVLLISTLFSRHAFAQDYIRWELPEGAKMRLGKGKIANFEGHLTDIGRARSYQFSLDSSQLAVISSIGIWLYDVQTGGELTLTAGHLNGMSNDIALGPDWQTFAMIRANSNTVELRDLYTGKLKKTFEGPEKQLVSIAFSPDSKMLAGGDFDGVIWLWDIVTGERTRIRTSHKIVNEVMFSPDGKTIISSRRRDTRLWDIATGEFKAHLEDTTGTRNIVYTPDGTTLYGRNRGELRLWDPDNGKIKMRLELPNASNRPLSAFSPDGQIIATAGGNDYKVQLWNLQTGRLKNALAGDPKYVKGIMISDGVPKLVDYATKRVRSITFSPDGRTLAVSSDNEIVFWDPSTGEHKAMLAGKGSFYNLLFSPDGRTLAARNESGIHLWNINTTDIQKSALQHTITGYGWEVNSIAFSPDGKSLASGYERKNIKLWDVSTGQLKKVFKGHRYPLWVQSIAFSPNGDTLASLSLSIQSSDHKAEILLWDTATGEYQVTLKGHGKIPDNRIPNRSGIAFSPNGKILASGSGDGTIRLWDAKAAVSNSFFHRLWRPFFRHHKATLKGHTYHVLSVAFTPDGRTLASGSLDETVRVWDLRTKKLKATLAGHTEEILTVTFSPDGSTLASGCEDGAIHLWDPDTGEHKVSLIGNNLFTRPASLPRRKDDPPYITARSRGAVTSLVFSSDGKTLANGNSDGTIHFWDLRTRQIKSTFSGPSGLNSLAFSPDGQTIASGSSDGTILIWELEP